MKKGGIGTDHSGVVSYDLDVTTYACDQNSFRVVTLVGTSQAFYNWVFSFQGKIKIKGPDTVRLEYEQQVRNAAVTLNV